MKKVLIVLFIIEIISLMVNSLHAAEFGGNSAKIDNTYATLKIGSSKILSGYGNKTGLFVYEHMVGPEIVDGVKCVRAIIVDTVRAFFQSIWFAQDIYGEVYLLQFYDSNNLAPVVFGKNTTVLAMPKNPQVGDNIWGNSHTVVDIGVTVPQFSTDLGPFTNCIKTMDVDNNIHYFAPNISRVKTEYPSGDGIEMREFFYSKGKVVVIPLYD